MNNRPSFNIDKVGKYNIGPTGITGTSDSSIKPKDSIVDFTEGTYNSSELLVRNINKLGSDLLKLNHEQNESNEMNEIKDFNEDIDEDNIEDNFDLLSEEEIASNLEYHISFNKKATQKGNKSDSIKCSEDKFCRNCGQKFLQIDNYCGNCGATRNKVK